MTVVCWLSELNKLNKYKVL